MAVINSVHAVSYSFEATMYFILFLDPDRHLRKKIFSWYWDLVIRTYLWKCLWICTLHPNHHCKMLSVQTTGPFSITHFMSKISCVVKQVCEFIDVYQTRVEVTGIDNSSFLHYSSISYCCRILYGTYLLMGTWCMLIIRFNVNISEEKDYLIKFFFTCLWSNCNLIAS
jgi:hypothetical protein